MSECRIDPAWQPTETLQDLAAAGFGAAVAELIEDFRSDTAARLERLRTALLTGDLAAARKEAHSIKGSALQMGANEVASRALLIEAAEGGGLLGGELTGLESALCETWSGMQEYLGR